MHDDSVPNITNTPTTGATGIKRKRKWPVVASALGVVVLGLAYYLWPPDYRLEKDFPSAGYRLLSPPGLEGGPGALQGEDANHVLWPVANLKLNAEPTVVAVAEIDTSRRVSVSLEGLQRLFGTSTSATGFNASGRTGTRETVSFKLLNPKRVQITDTELTQPLLDIWPSREKRLFEYKKFFIVQEAILADGIEFIVSRNSDFAAAFAAPDSITATTSPSGITTQPTATTEGERGSQYKLIATFPKPLYVFVKAREVSEAAIEKLGVKTAFAVGVTADFVETTVKPGQVVKKTVRGESVMLAQKNGPFGAVHSAAAKVDIELPASAEVLSKRAFWTTNGKESGKTAEAPQQSGRVLTATGSLRGNDVSWGPRTWGELNLEIEYRVPSTATRATVVEQIQPSKVVTERNYVLQLPRDKPIPAEVRVELQDVAVDDRKATVTIAAPPNDTGTSTAKALDGRFELVLDAKNRTLTISRKAPV